MNYIKHLTAYFDHVVNDHSLNPTHISLYIALFQFWNLNRFQNPISITRDEVMRISKICSKATYHKCVRELHEKGYIIYEPSYNPFKGSMVYMVNLSEQLKPTNQRKKANSENRQVNEQVVNKHCTGSGTGTEQALVSSINNTNIINSNKHNKLFKEEHIQKNELENQFLKLEESKAKKKLREKKGNESVVIPSVSSRAESRDEGKIPPEWNNVLDFFREKNATEIDAQKFYNHFQSNGWLVGGKSKMKDWKAAARNWLLNSQKFNSKSRHPELGEGPKPNHLHTSTQKNYGEPL